MIILLLLPTDYNRRGHPVIIKPKDYEKDTFLEDRQVFFSTLAMLLLLAIPFRATAQLRIVDDNDGRPVQGAYIFGSNGTLLCISDADGKTKKLDGTITISNIAYEGATVDASTTKGDVRLKPKAYSLPEITVDKADYVKLSGAFRDICRNNGKAILYREGLMDFYINIKSGKINRHVRACRQYEIKTLRRLVNFNIAILGQARSTDLAHVKYIKRDSISGENGDTVFYKSHYKGTSADSAIMYIDTHREGLYRHIIDNTKYANSDNMLLTVKDAISDWTFSSRKETWSSLVSYRNIFNYDLCPLPNKAPIAAEEMRDYVVTDVQTLTKEQAEKELKDKSETDDFTLPDCMPAFPYDVAKETEGLVKKKFWEM